MSIDKYIDFNPLVIPPNTLLKDAVSLMAQKRSPEGANCLLIVAANKLRGILTKGDIVRLVATEINLATTTVEQVMTQPVITIQQKQCRNLLEIELFLRQNLVSYLPILQDNHELLGVVDAYSLIQSRNRETFNDDLSLANAHSQEELARFFNLSSVQCVAGLDGYFKRVNPAFCQTLGFTADELLAEPYINFVHPEDRSTTIAEVENLAAGKTTVSFENRYRTKDGEYRWLLWTAKAYLEERLIYATAQEISDRKHSEQLLKESEERWQLALKGANDGIWDWNVKTNQVFFSKRWKEMLGFAEDEISNTLEEWSKRVHPDDLDWVTKIIQEHFAGKTPFYSSEHRVLCKDGSYKWILDRGQALWDEAGNVIRMTGSHTDITDRRQAEEELAKSENLLRTIIDSEPECVTILGQDGKLLEINPAGLAMIEADSLAEAIDKSIYPLIHADDRQAFIDLTKSVFEGKSAKLEFKLTGLKGTARWLETNAVPLKEGNRITALLAVARDITQRKQTELQLQQERDFSKATIDTVGALVAVLDCQGAIVSFNHACERITGYSFAEVKDKIIWDCLICPEEKTAYKAVFERLLDGQFHQQYENYWLAKNGGKHLISWSNTALFDAEGEIEFIIATGIDVTEQRRVWNKLEFQYRQTQLLTEITDKIRMSIELEEILQTTVTEVQHLLACDRVLIIELEPNNIAVPISEAILPDLTPMLGYELADPLLMGKYLARYRQGKVLAIDNIATASIDLDIKQLLKQFQIQAKLVVPILAQGELKGLLVVHQCYSPRQWQEAEIQLLNQLSDRLGVALSQAQLLDYAERLALERTQELTATNKLLESEIAERKQTERDLTENQQKLADIMDNADEAIITIDERQKIQLFNQGAEKIFGYRATEIMGKPLDILLPEVFRQIHHQHISNFGHSGEQSRKMAERNSNVFGRHKDGREFPAEASIAKLQTKSGMLFTVMLKDVSEQQKTLKKLRASQTLLAKAEKIAKVGSWEYDHETKQKTWSDELFNILGFDKNSSIPGCQEIMERIHPEDRRLVSNTLVAGHQTGQSWELNYRLLLPDGTIKYIESRGEPTVDPEGKVLKVLEIIMDVSDRVRAEKSLERSEEQLELITDALPVLIAYIDDRQCYRYNNRTYETWYGKSRSSLIGLPIKQLVGKENYHKMRPYIEMALSGKEVTFEAQPTADNGNSYWMSATYIPDLDLDGRVKGFFSMVEDITERKTIERMKSEFISIASHEMRTPLTSIHGVIKLLCAGRLGELSESGLKMADMALRNSDRLVHLVNDVLDLERMESGRDEITKTTCNSAELIKQALDTVSSMAREQQITLETDAKSIEFLGDCERLTQALTNLLSNAIKFSPANSKVAIASKLQKDYILFSVADRGRGIPPDKLETIFERFQQVDASDSRKKGGTGLGLAISRHIIEQHDGKIWVKSVYGVGSTFYFKIPLP